MKTKTIMLGILIGIATMTFAQTGSIKGNITDKNTNSVIQSVKVAVQLSPTRFVSATSDLLGSYELKNVDEGKQTVLFSANGYKSVKKTVTVIAGQSVTLNVAMEPKLIITDAKDIDNKIKKEERGKVAEEKASYNMPCTKSIATGASAYAPMEYEYTTSYKGFNGNKKNDEWFTVHNTEEYDKINDNEFLSAKENPLSTFSIDVDRASYANMRRFINSNQMPPKDAVRIEEMVNYFDYTYKQPTNEDPFSVYLEAADCPWNEKHKLVMIGLKGKEVETEKLPPSNLVFLIDVSGSMSMPNKLPLLKQSFKIMVDQLRPEDRVAIVVYAGAAGEVLKSTSGNNKTKIMNAIEKLEAGGSTAGGEGIELAYKIAKDNFIKDGNNRVILATDGDFNVGVSSNGDLVRIIEKKREEKVFLTILGFGMGNYKDSKMEQLSNAGNGNYGYIDNILEAKKMLGKEIWGTLFTIAKDVKIQIEFNPNKVKSYRLIGYENRMLKKEDFNDDKKDAGEIGAGHTVTALYEIVPADSDEPTASIDPLEYQTTNFVKSENLMTLKLRYKQPDGDISKLISQKIKMSDIATKKTSENFRFAASVASFGMLLRDSEFKGKSSYSKVLELAKSAKGNDVDGYRAEFIKLVEMADLLSKGNYAKNTSNFYEE